MEGLWIWHKKFGSGPLSSHSEYLNRHTRKGMGSASCHSWMGALCFLPDILLKRFRYMSKKVTSKILVVLVLFLFLPSVTFAAWWNPFTWKIFKKKEVIPQVQVEVQKTSEEKIAELQKQLDNLKKQQPVSAPTATIPKEKEVKKIIPVVDKSAATKAEAQEKIEAELKIKAEQDALIAKQKADAQAIIESLHKEYLLFMDATSKEIDKLTEGNDYRSRGWNYLASKNNVLAISPLGDSIEAYNRALTINDTLTIPLNLPFSDKLKQLKKLGASLIKISKLKAQNYKSLVQLYIDYPNSAFDTKTKLLNEFGVLSTQEKDISDQFFNLNIEIAQEAVIYFKKK